MNDIVLVPRLKKIMKNLGENIKLARLRRKLNKKQVSERAGISVETLQLIEDGNYDIPIGIYLKVFSVLGLESDIEKLALDDILGRKLQDIELLKNDKEK